MVFVCREREKKKGKKKGTKNVLKQKEKYVEYAVTKNKAKTSRSSFPLNPATDLHLHRKTAPNSHSYKQIAEAHLGIALRHIPFERDGGLLKGNAIPPDLGHAEFGTSRGVDLVKQPHELKQYQNTRTNEWDSSKKDETETNNNKKSKRRQSSTVFFFFQIETPIINFRQTWNHLISWFDNNSSVVDANGWNGWINHIIRRIVQNPHNNHLKTKKRSSTSNDPTSTPSQDNFMEEEEISNEQRALFHLQQASDLGNHHAMKIVANSLASGILPIDNSAKVIQSSFSNNDLFNVTGLTVHDDFSNGDNQLSRAIALWHASAMEGDIEAAMTMGYRHLYSAAGGRLDPNSISKDILIKDKDVHRILNEMDKESTSNNIDSNGNIFHSNQPSKGTQQQQQYQTGKKHSASPAAHYGVLGTCESAMLYYEAAANAVMDELEASSLRGKTAPFIDNHHLPEIHIHGGASSALAHHNKPDELEEALQYYQIRASRSNAEPDVSAAYTLANLYHFGIRGVKQDLTLALKYYEIAADLGSWEAAGQAGKFHLWGMGMDEKDRDLDKALNYFRKGAPGGLEGCTYRLKRNTQQNKNKKKSKQSEDTDEEASDNEQDLYDDAICDHPCVNGMGLLHSFGVPGRLPVNLKRAEKYFTLGRDMGNMDSSYNLAMLKLGWLKKRNSNDNVDVYDEIDVEQEVEMITGVTRGDMEKKALSLAKKLLGDDAENAKIEVEVLNLAHDLSDKFDKEKQFKDAMSGFVESPSTKSSPGPTFSDYSFAMTELSRASNRGHIQAKHRLAMMYARGVTLSNRNASKKPSVAVSKSCHKALMYYKEIADGGTTIARRLRAAYKQHVNGDYENSLRNYLAAAETGSVTAQINAAFLLERGHCLGLSHTNCMKASVRLWKAAAKQGNEEACVRVGDFYYYGRLRKDEESRVIPDENSKTVGIKFIERSKRYASSPFWWTRYLLYPEDLIPVTRQTMINCVRGLITTFSSTKTSDDVKFSSSGTCRNDDMDGDAAQTCSNADSASPNENTESEKENHLATAAQYYRKAAEEYGSARANFNLGFMYQWGLGVKQDFPLAKRHYDLSGSHNSGKAEIAVKLALFCMKLHQDTLRALVQWNEWQGKYWRRSKHTSPKNDNIDKQKTDSMPTPSPMTDNRKKTASDIILSHLLSWEMAFILLLSVIVTRLVKYSTRTRRSEQS